MKISNRQRFIYELTFTQQTEEKMKKRLLLHVTNIFLSIYLKQKKRRCWLKIIVLNYKKFNLHFKIKIQFQFPTIIIQGIKNRF